MIEAIEKRWELAVPPARAFDDWLSEDAVFPPTERLEIVAEAGGPYRLSMPGGMVMDGRILELEPSRGLRMRWQWRGSTETTEITVRFEDDGAGGTVIALVHGGFDTEASRADHDAGWDAYITNFRTFTQGRAGHDGLR